MIRKKTTKATTTLASAEGYLDDEQFEQLSSKLLADIQKGVDARAAADDAKASAGEAIETSIENFVADLSGMNGRLKPEQEIALAGTCASPYATGSQAARKSEYLTLIRQKERLPALFDGVKSIRDEVKAKDPKASVNVREKLIKAARIAAKDETRTVSQVLKDLKAIMIPAPKTDEEKAGALIDRVSDLDVLHEKVGDERVLKPRAEKALQDLRDLAQGRDPVDVEVTESPEYQALEKRYEALKQKVARARLKNPAKVVDLDPEEVAEPFPGVDSSLAEALNATLEARDTSEGEDAASEPGTDTSEESSWVVPEGWGEAETSVNEDEDDEGKPKPGSREASVGTSLTQFSIEELLAMQSGKK